MAAKRTSTAKKTTTKTHAKPRQPKAITPEVRARVAEYAGLGLTWSQISGVLKVPERTLQRYCQEDYNDGKAQKGAIAVAKLWQLVEGGHPASIFFFLKTQMGWKETSKNELSGPDGKPIQTEGNLEVEVTPEKVKAIMAALDKEF
jgi:hypothetical protein